MFESTYDEIDEAGNQPFLPADAQAEDTQPNSDDKLPDTQPSPKLTDDIGGTFAAPNSTALQTATRTAVEVALDPDKLRSETLRELTLYLEKNEGFPSSSSLEALGNLSIARIEKIIAGFNATHPLLPNLSGGLVIYNFPHGNLVLKAKGLRFVNLFEEVPGSGWSPSSRPTPIPSTLPATRGTPVPPASRPFSLPPPASVPRPEIKGKNGETTQPSQGKTETIQTSESGEPSGVVISRIIDIDGIDSQVPPKQTPSLEILMSAVPRKKRETPVSISPTDADSIRITKLQANLAGSIHDLNTFKEENDLSAYGSQREFYLGMLIALLHDSFLQKFCVIENEGTTMNMQVKRKDVVIDESSLIEVNYLKIVDKLEKFLPLLNEMEQRWWHRP